MRKEDEPVRNLAGYTFLDIEGYEVNEWHPLPNGEGKPTQVHFVLYPSTDLTPIVLRLKSAKRVDELIEALQKHREGVWGLL